jgi:hypothetical protein
MDSDSFDQTDPVADVAEKGGSEADEQALNSDLGHGRCRRCGGPVRSRRRKNGYCGDRCRLRDHRDKVRDRRMALLDRISTVVEELRRELNG